MIGLARIGDPRRLIPSAALAALFVLPAGAARTMVPVVAAFESAGRQLTFVCGSDRAIWLNVSGLPDSSARSSALEIRIGARTFRLRAIDLDEWLLLSDLRAPGKGVSRNLVSAAKAGRAIELIDRAAKSPPVESQAFRLPNARAAIENVERSCGLKPVR